MRFGFLFKLYKKSHDHPSKNPANVIRLLSLEYLDLSSQRLKWEIFSIQPVTFVFYATAAAVAVASWKNSSSSFLSTLLIVQLSTICLDPIEITKLKFPTRSGGPKGKLLLRKNFRRIRRKEADVTTGVGRANRISTLAFFFFKRLAFSFFFWILYAISSSSIWKERSEWKYTSESSSVKESFHSFFWC